MEYEDQAIRDSATGLYNLRYWNEQVYFEWERAKRYDLPLSVVLYRVAVPEAIKTSLLRVQRDETMKLAADMIVKASRKVDSVYRNGDLELAALLPQTDLDGADQYTNNVLSQHVSIPLTGLDTELRVPLVAAILQIHPVEDPIQLGSLSKILLGALLKTSSSNRFVRISNYNTAKDDFPFD